MVSSSNNIQHIPHLKNEVTLACSENNYGMSPFQASCNLTTMMSLVFIFSICTFISMQRLTVDNNVLFCFLDSQDVPVIFSAGVVYLAVIQYLIYRFMRRGFYSLNGIIICITNPALSSVRFTSKLRSHWHARLYTCV